MGITYSESLKLLVQQFGAYIHSKDMFPHLWQGVSPLHLILRRLHSLLPGISLKFNMEMRED